jgi:hypothetical protein
MRGRQALVALPYYVAWYPRSQQGFHENVRQLEPPTPASYQALVAVARAWNLPKKAPARIAHPHAT